MDQVTAVSQGEDCRSRLPFAPPQDDRNVTTEQSYRLPDLHRMRQHADRQYTAFFPKRTARNARSLVAQCPSIWLGSKISRIYSRYMRERQTGRWSPRIGMKADDISRSPKTVANIAYVVVDFLNWLDAYGISSEEATYFVVRAYQSDILNGRWGKGSRELSPDWANEKADEACSLLRWLAARGFRREFNVETRTVRTPLGELREVRIGRAKGGRDPGRVLALPDEHKVSGWLEQVRQRKGRAKSLACRAIVELATRKRETCSIEVHQWPSERAIKEAEHAGKKHVRILITKNTKSSRPRAIDFDVQYAKIVRNWIDGPRGALEDVYFRRTGVRTPQLFLSDAPGFEGTPISPASLYTCFKLRVPDGPEIWYPHLGRHYSICVGLIEGLRRDAAALNRQLFDMPMNWVRNRTEYWLNIQRRKAGHISAQTTEIYTQWLDTNCILKPTSDEWAMFLQAGDGE